MNGNIKIIICVFVLYCVLCVESEPGVLIEPDIEEYDDESEFERFHHEVSDRQVKSTVYKTVNKYYCSVDPTIEGSHLIVYGSKGWTFPVQDVNLTLRYPTAVATHNHKVEVNDTVFDTSPETDASFDRDEEEYLITGFKVILYIDGPTSQGYIIDGGVLQDTITLSFVSSQLTTLKYQFWMYGVRKDTPGAVEHNVLYHLC